MLLVSADNHKDRRILQKEFSFKNKHYIVPPTQRQTLVPIVQSISFQLFQNNLPALAQKVQKLVIDSIHMTLSLTLLRETMTLIKLQQQSLEVYRSHYIEMNKVFLQQSQCQVSRNQIPLICNDDCSIDEASRKNISQTNTDVSIYLPGNEEQKQMQDNEVVTQKTILSQLEEISQIQNNFETQKTSNKLAHFLESDSKMFCQDQWKTKRQIANDDLRQIEYLPNISLSVLERNNELPLLIADQLSYDLTQQLHPSAHPKQQGQRSKFKYKKLIKDLVMNSKMRLGKKR